MNVSIEIPAIMQSVTNNVDLISSAGSNVLEVFEQADKAYPGLKDRVITDKDIHRYVNIYLNEDDIRFENGVDTVVKEGDKIIILPAVAGG